ncbi:hypothetical protein DFJ43DRAFT_1041577 [Lentinula guzmanii]|uniref:Uncharacterized protein n=1 Tax=Lentinula guzmanii TaxID=2804957 RepID=A0AA38JEX3_9AGAR|nr:hypothetical protein DFJ43DRAFT_1041577 [Lentinula guzmanii]
MRSNTSLPFVVCILVSLLRLVAASPLIVGGASPGTGPITARMSHSNFEKRADGPKTAWKLLPAGFYVDKQGGVLTFGSKHSYTKADGKVEYKPLTKGQTITPLGFKVLVYPLDDAKTITEVTEETGGTEWVVDALDSLMQRHNWLIDEYHLKQVKKLTSIEDKVNKVQQSIEEASNHVSAKP